MKREPLYDPRSVLLVLGGFACVPVIGALIMLLTLLLAYSPIPNP